MFLDTESTVFLFQHHRQVNIERGILFTQRFVVSVLDKATGIFAISFAVDIVFHILRIEIFDAEEAALAVDHRLAFAFAVDHQQWCNIVLFGYTVVVSTKSWCDVNNAGTIVGGYKISGYHPEGIAHWGYPGHQLFVLGACQFAATVFGQQTVRDIFPFAFVFFKRKSFIFFREEIAIEIFGQDNGNRQPCVWVEASDLHIPDIGANSQCGVRWQCPGGGGPGQNEKFGFHVGKELLRSTVANHFKLSYTGGIFYIAVATRLVQFVRTQSGSGCGRIGLYGITLVEHIFVVQIFEQPPQGFDIAVVVGDVGVVHIDPIAHFVGQIFPHIGIFHHLFAAGSIVFGYRNGFANIFLGNAKRLLDT